MKLLLVFVAAVLALPLAKMDPAGALCVTPSDSNPDPKYAGMHKCTACIRNSRCEWNPTKNQCQIGILHRRSKLVLSTVPQCGGYYLNGAVPVPVTKETLAAARERANAYDPDIVAFLDPPYYCDEEHIFHCKNQVGENNAECQKIMADCKKTFGEDKTLLSDENYCQAYLNAGGLLRHQMLKRLISIYQVKEKDKGLIEKADDAWGVAADLAQVDIGQAAGAALASRSLILMVADKWADDVEKNLQLAAIVCPLIKSCEQQTIRREDMSGSSFHSIPCEPCRDLEFMQVFALPGSKTALACEERDFGMGFNQQFIKELTQ